MIATRICLAFILILALAPLRLFAAEDEPSSSMAKAVRSLCESAASGKCEVAGTILKTQSALCEVQNKVFNCPRPEDVSLEDRTQLRRCDDPVAMCEETAYMGWDAVRGCLTGALVSLDNFGSLIANTGAAAIELVQQAAAESAAIQEWLNACDLTCKKSLAKDLKGWAGKSDAELNAVDARVLWETYLAVKESRERVQAMREMEEAAANIDGSAASPHLKGQSTLLWAAAEKKLRQAGLEVGCFGAKRRAQLICHAVFSIVYPRIAFQAVGKAVRLGKAVANFKRPVILNEVTLLNGGEAAASSVSPEGFSMYVWNVAKFKDPRSVQDAMKLSGSADLVALQEGYWSQEFRKLVARDDGRWWGGVVSFQDKEGVATGVVNGGRVAPSNATGLMTTAREPILNTPKTMMATLYPIKGRPDQLMVLNVHAINFVPQKSFESQLTQIAKALEAHKGPVVLAGDFNTWSPARLKALSDLTNRNGLQHVANLDNDRRLLKLDHIFVRDLDVKKAKVETSITSSDHKPIYIELQAR